MVKKDLAFVLKRHNFRETSIISTLYTRRYGKITGILKGFYTQKREFSSPFDIGSLNEITFYPKRKEIWLVSFADLVNDYAYLRRDRSKARVAGMFLNLVERTMQLWDVHPEVFDLLEQSLSTLSFEDEEKVFYVFLIQLLTLSGVKPEINLCINCHGDLDGHMFFSVEKGGLVCHRCRDKVSGLQKINRQTASSLLYIQKHPMDMALRLKTSFPSRAEMFRILSDFLMYHLDLSIPTELRPVKRRRMFSFVR